MAIYYALVDGESIRYDENTGQLEIYETEEEAIENIEVGVSKVVAITASRLRDDQ